MLVTNEHAELIKVDADFAALLGYLPHEMLGINGFRLLHTADLDLAREIFLNLMNGELEQVSLDLRLVDRNNNTVPVTVQALSFPGNTIGSRQLAVSVNARAVPRGGELMSSSDRYRRLVESAQAIPFEYNAKTRSYTFVGPQAVKILGYPIEAWYRPKFWHSMAHPEDVEAANEAYWSAPQKDGQVDVRYRVLDAAGNTRWLREVAIAVSDESGPLSYWGFLFDITERMEAQEALRASELQLRQVSETVLDLVCMMDGQGHYTYVSPSYKPTLGYEPDSLLGRNAFDLVHPEDRSRVRTLFIQHLSTQLPGLVRFRFLDARGEYVWMESVGNVLKCDEGRLLGAVISSRDISKQMETESALTRSLERFRMLVESTGVVAYEFNATSGNITYMAPQVEQLLGFPAERWYDKDFWRAHVHPEDLRYTDALLQEVEEGDESVSATYRMLNSESEYVWVKDVFYPQVSGGVLGEVRGFLIDIDEEKAVEEELTASRERFRLLVESTGIVAYESDLSRGQLSYVGPQIEQLLGHKLENWYRPSFWQESIFPEDLEETRRQQAEARRKGQPIQLVYRMFHAQGHTIWVRDHYFPVVLDGQVVGERGFVVDVSAEKQAEREREEMEKQVQQAQRMESLGQMAGGIAHDFNNLLTAIGGYAELAARETAEPETRQLVEQIVNSTRRAADLTRQLLAYSGQGRRVQLPCSINTIVREMSTLLQSVISRKVGLRFELSDDEQVVVGEASQLRQVVMELLSNASDSIGDNKGEIVLRSSHEFVRRAENDALYSDGPPKPGAYVVLEVEDTGCGMDAQSLKRIFDPFFTTKFTGRGLGLAAVRGIVHAHGGTVRVESRPGLGTCIRVYLPSQLSLPTALPSLPQPPQVRERIADDQKVQLQLEGAVLVVDDEESVRAITRAILVKQGLEVITACDGVEAVEAVRRHGSELALVLLDVTMPRKSGIEAFREIREIRPDLRVVLSSGYSQTEAYRQFGQEGLCGFIQKPYLRQELLDSLSSFLNARQPAPAEV